MELLARYLNAVRPLLPKGQRQDILQELSANLLSQMEDREAELGRPLSAAEQEAILERHGPPLVVAGRYRPDDRSVAFGRRWIGPALFPLYVKILSLNLGLTLAVSVVAVVVVSGRRSIAPSLPAIVLHLLLQFAIVTLVFAAAELHATRFPDAWNPRRPRAPRGGEDRLQVPRSQSVAELVVGTVFVFWWLDVPRGLQGIFAPAAVLRGGPGWEILYRPVLWLALLAMAAPCVTLFRPRRVRLRSWARLLSTTLFLAIVCLSLRAGDWVVLASPGRPAPDRALAAAVNRWFGISLAVVAAACALHILWELWRLAGRRSHRSPAGLTFP